MSFRVCYCTGYLNNPGGVCCRDLYKQPSTFPIIPPPSTVPPAKNIPRIKSIEYHPDGTIKKIEYFDD